MRARALATALVIAGAAPHAADASPGAPTRARAWIAELSAPTPAWRKPAAAGRARWLSPVGAWTGGPVGLLVVKARRGWVRVRLPTRPNTASAWVPAAACGSPHPLARGARPERTTGDRAAGGPAGAPLRRRDRGPATPTPTGRFAIYEVDRQPDPFGFLGPVALHLTAHSSVLENYGGGPGRVAIHGRGGASLLVPLGSAASHGCIRVDSLQAAWLARGLRPGVPVTVRGGASVQIAQRAAT